MKLQKLTLAAIFSVGILGMNLPTTGAADGILYKVQAGNSNYCHLKFPAIREETLSWDRPVLKPASAGTLSTSTALVILIQQGKKPSKLKNAMSTTF